MSNVVGQETMILILYLLSSTTVISWSTKFDEMRQWLTKVITMAWAWHHCGSRNYHCVETTIFNHDKVVVPS